MCYRLKKLIIFLWYISLILALGYLLYIIPSKLAALGVFGLAVLLNVKLNRFKRYVNEVFKTLDKRLKAQHKNLVKLDKELVALEKDQDSLRGRLKNYYEISTKNYDLLKSDLQKLKNAHNISINSINRFINSNKE